MPSKTLHRIDGGFFGPGGFDGDDIIDIVNPLHHLPVVGMVYRAITGDRISPGAKIIGGGILGGPTGLVSSMVRVGIERVSGRSVGGHIAHLAGFDPPGTASPSRAAGAYAQAAAVNQPRFAALPVNGESPPPAPPPSVLSAAGDFALGQRQDGANRQMASRSPPPSRATATPLPVAGDVTPPAGAANRPSIRYVWSVGPAGSAGAGPVGAGPAAAATLASVPGGAVRHPV